MDIFVQKDSTCFPYRLKLNHHKIIKGVKQVQNNITTLLLEIQDVKVTGAEADHGDGKNCFKRSRKRLKHPARKLREEKRHRSPPCSRSDAIQVACFLPIFFHKDSPSNHSPFSLNKQGDKQRTRGVAHLLTSLQESA